MLFLISQFWLQSQNFDFVLENSAVISKIWLHSRNSFHFILGILTLNYHNSRRIKSKCRDVRIKCKVLCARAWWRASVFASFPFTEDFIHEIFNLKLRRNGRLGDTPPRLYHHLDSTSIQFRKINKLKKKYLQFTPAKKKKANLQMNAFSVSFHLDRQSF